jgi:hypothetical protein
MEGDGGSSVLVPFGSLGGEGAVDVGGDGCISVCPTAGGGVSAGTGGAAVATGWGCMDRLARAAQAWQRGDRSDEHEATSSHHERQGLHSTYRGG